MKSFFLPMLLVAVLVAFGAAAAQAGVKVEICHIPPGNPENFHTIKVSEKALPAHLAHGDLPGSCAEYCEALCDDDDACTVDACDEAGNCLVDHPPVDCDDSLSCTTDSCDSASGSCINTPVTCVPPDLCTVSTCNEYEHGACVDTTKFCDSDEVCELSTGDCVDPCSGVVCDEALECQIGSCAAGVCTYDTALDGTPCNDGDSTTLNDACAGGVCTGELCIDTDGDLVCDTDEECPNDLYKTEPGVCGCGVPDTDTDEDGVADCIDNCPTDPDKTEPGQCGCGNEETDIDADGTVDCGLCPDGQPPSCNPPATVIVSSEIPGTSTIPTMTWASQTFAVYSPVCPPGTAISQAAIISASPSSDCVAQHYQVDNVPIGYTTFKLIAREDLNKAECEITVVLNGPILDYTSYIHYTNCRCAAVCSP